MLRSSCPRSNAEAQGKVAKIGWLAVRPACKAGKLLYIGFTGHKDSRIHLYMLEVAKQHGFKFDTVQMPLNVMDAHYRSFEKLVLPALVKQKIGVLGMKSMGNGIILKSNTVTPIECLHYALNLPTSVDSRASIRSHANLPPDKQIPGEIVAGKNGESGIAR